MYACELTYNDKIRLRNRRDGVDLEEEEKDTLMDGGIRW